MTPTDLFGGIRLLIAAYLTIGSLFSVIFHRHGIHAMDPAARNAGLGFRLIVTPGLIALWPVIARRWIQAKGGGYGRFEPPRGPSPERLRSHHALLWKAFAILLPGILAIALHERPTPDVPKSGTAAETTLHTPTRPSPPKP